VVPLPSYAGTAWPELVHQIERRLKDLKAGWLILDTFYAIAGLGGEEEGKAGAVDQAVAPLRHVAAVNDVAITLGRHERKSGGEVGVSGRGSTALTGAADVVCLLKRLPGNQFPNRRQLDVTGRIEQARLIIELLQDGRYIIATEDGQQNSRVEVAKLTTAIMANLKMTKLELQETTGIGRNRIEKLAAKDGWKYAPKVGWTRGPV
jgi:hypothetical protein